MKLSGRTAMYNYYRDRRNDQWALIIFLALGWLSDAHLHYSFEASSGIAFVGAVMFRFLIWYTPWSESIRWESREHINSTPWQPMNTLDDLRVAPPEAYSDEI